MKLKLVVTQEFVVGGWTEPRGGRSHFGRPAARRVWTATRSSTWGTRARASTQELDKVARLLRPLETGECPFRVTPKSNERRTG